MFVEVVGKEWGGLGLGQESSFFLKTLFYSSLSLTVHADGLGVFLFF